jgi:hypothetical protein
MTSAAPTLRLACFLAWLGLTAPPGAALAQATLQAAAAQKLFAEASRELDARQFASACPKLEVVTRMVPEGIGGRMALAECHEGWGKLASAWSHYLAAQGMATAAGQKQRAKECAAKVAELEPKLAMLTVQVPAEVKAAPEVEIRRDGVALQVVQWGAAIPVDGGAHELTVTARGRAPRKWTVTVADGQKAAVTLQLGAPVGEVAIGARGGRSKVPGIALAAAGAASLITGGILVGVAAAGLEQNRALAPKDEGGAPLCAREPRPGEPGACESMRANADFAVTGGNAGMGLLVGGGVLAAGAVIYLLLPDRAAASKTSRVVVAAGKDGGGLMVTGAF